MLPRLSRFLAEAHEPVCIRRLLQSPNDRIAPFGLRSQFYHVSELFVLQVISYHLKHRKSSSKPGITII